MRHRQMLLAIKAAQRPATLRLALSSVLFASPPIARAFAESAIFQEASRSSRKAQTPVEPFPSPTGIFVSRATAAKCSQNKPTRCRNICDYCDVYLTHDSMSVRKAHNSGRNHLRNVVEYYQQIGQEKAQSVIDSITSSYAAEGQPLPNPAMVPGAFPPPFGFPAPGGLPFPPPFPGVGATGTPPTGGFPPPSQHARRPAPAPWWLPRELPDPPTRDGRCFPSSDASSRRCVALTHPHWAPWLRGVCPASWPGRPVVIFHWGAVLCSKFSLRFPISTSSHWMNPPSYS
ncbi:hypothetical protein N7476_010213 [Penicillium atrosanguineum]|uniref:U1 small nuclear ribonucleoprotein C n=1 Tax=Penicillium atrosanguineum TaxID=1132637 RepID=A0A9W9PPR4_9EURO|nr:hypothetical protein N7476_010213 [Penicillium atrosanguineum]